jgi:hypothetical protein
MVQTEDSPYNGGYFKVSVRVLIFAIFYPAFYSNKLINLYVLLLTTAPTGPNDIPP